MSRLDVPSGETYSVPGGTTEEWAGVDVEGTLDVDGHLKLVDNPDVPTTEAPSEGFDIGTDPIDLPFGITLPTSLDNLRLEEDIPGGLDLPTRPLSLNTMETGIAIFMLGTMSILTGAVAFFRNYAAGIALMLAFLALIMSGLFQISLELFWTLVAATLILLVMGLIARWMQA